MLFTQVKKEWAERALAPHAAALLAAMEHPLKDETYLAIEPVLGGWTVIKEALDAYPIMAADASSDAFVIDLHRQFAGTVKVLTPKQCRAMANVLRHALRETNDTFAPPTYTPPTASSSTPATAPAPAKPFYDKSTKTYRCFNCNVTLTGIDALYDHRMKEHGIKPPASYHGPAGSSPTSTVTHAGGPAPSTVLATFVPKLNLDLSVLPESGRYALPPSPTTGLASPWFVIIKQVRRPYSRRGRFIWGVNRRGYAEYIEKGRWEVRVQSGDTKDLVGEQKVGNVYHGEHEELLAEVLADPAKAMSLYGVLLGVCSYCGRSLTDDLSRLRGIGPDCWENKHIPFVSSRAKLALKAGV